MLSLAIQKLLNPRGRFRSLSIRIQVRLVFYILATGYDDISIELFTCTQV
jgi:hypothetical protein